MKPALATSIPPGFLPTATRFQRRVLLAVAGAAALLYAGAYLARLPDRVNRWDFSHYYTSALVLRHGLNPYTTDLAPYGRELGLRIDEINRGTYTPTFLLCFEPLTLMRPATAYWVWFALSGVCLVTAMAILLGEKPRLGMGATSWLIVAVLLYVPLRMHIYFAQSQLLILLMLVLMIRWLERGRDAPAGLILAAATLLRGFPLVMAGYLVVRRRCRALAWLGLGLAGGGLATVYAVGIDHVLGFLYAIGFVTSHRFIENLGNVALGSFISRVFWYIGGPAPTAPLELARQAVVWLAGGALAVLTLRATLRSVADTDDRDRRDFSLWVVTMIMLSPTAWVHYMVLLFIPFVAITRAAGGGRVSRRAVVAMLASYLLTEVCGLTLNMMGARLPPGLHVFLGEGISVSLIVAYLSGYWFAIDESEEMGKSVSASAGAAVGA